MESWRLAWRVGLEPLLPDAALEVIRTALLTDDPQLIQGRTLLPLPATAYDDCKGACLIAYAGWQSEKLETVWEVEEYFARKCFDMEVALKNSGGCGWLLTWFDETPRENMRTSLLPEVQLAIANRKEKACPTVPPPA